MRRRRSSTSTWDTLQRRRQRVDKLKTHGWAAVAGMVAVIVLMYFLLNAITKGYFMWRLRAVAAARGDRGGAHYVRSRGSGIS
jgi:hypothetical protein